MNLMRQKVNTYIPSDMYDNKASEDTAINEITRNHQIW